MYGQLQKRGRKGRRENGGGQPRFHLALEVLKTLVSIRFWKDDIRVKFLREELSAGVKFVSIKLSFLAGRREEEARGKGREGGQLHPSPCLA